ncbi:MAG: TonB-dependent receptor plug domain-containing protein, partial [Coprobacter sp.]|nr:TonB-dependent receptor plug domain-containing protein [Coprobacter sp.]
MMRKRWITLCISALTLYPLGAQQSDTVSARLMNEITVTANRQKETMLHIPQSVSVITAGQIAFSNPQTAADMLSSDGVLSVQKSQQGGGSPTIRGFESSRILLVVDGVRMNNLIYRGGHLQNIITVDPNMLEQVEV